MRYALVNSQKVEAHKGIIDAVCPCCGNVVIPKCGSINIHHWSHKTERDCDLWYEPITEWHLSWQNLFPEESREVALGNHIADVFYRGLFWEFQHSFLSAEEIKEREAFYQTMVWVFDFREKYRKGQLKFLKKIDSDIEKRDEIFIFTVATISENLLNEIQTGDRKGEREVFLRMIYPKKTLLKIRSGSSKVNIAFDLGEDLLFLVNSYRNSQEDSPHIIDNFTDSYFKHFQNLRFDVHSQISDFCSKKVSDIENVKGFYGMLRNKQNFLENVFRPIQNIK